MPKFGIKNALFGSFWARTLKIIALYLKLVSSTFANCKIFEKRRTPKFETKNS